MRQLASLAWLKLKSPPLTCTHSNGHITKWSAFDAHNSIGKSFISVFVRTSTRTNLYIYEKEQKLKLRPETELEPESMLLFLSVPCVFDCLFAGRTSTAAKLVAGRMRNPFDAYVCVDVCKRRAHKSRQQSPIKVRPCSECTNRWNLPGLQVGAWSGPKARPLRSLVLRLDVLTFRRNAGDLIVRWICLKVCGLFASAAFVIAKSGGSFDLQRIKMRILWQGLELVVKRTARYKKTLSNFDFFSLSRCNYGLASISSSVCN